MNLAVNIPQINDATSFFRGAHPIAQLRETCSELHALQIASWAPSTLRMTDGLFCQRPFLTEHLEIILMAKDVGRKVWVDYDDYLLDVPTDNPTHMKYSTKENIENVKSILSQADIVTVSTEHLKKLYEPYNKNIKVIPNALDVALKVVKERTVAERRKIIAWRGSQTHQRDVFTYATSIMKACKGPESKDWQWHFIGDRLWFLTDSMPHYQTFLTKTMGAIEYLKHIQGIAPMAMQVPLHESEFNLCKSNIAWLEGCFAGAVTIGPDWKEWRVPGVLHYSNPEEYLDCLNAVLRGEVDTNKMAKEGWDYIQENLTLPHVNKARIKVLCELFECNENDLGCK